MSNKQEQPVMVNIQLDACEDLVCPSCGAKYFQSAYRLKVVPSLLSPTGKEEVVAIPVHYCVSCKAVIDPMLSLEQGEQIKEC